MLDMNDVKTLFLVSGPSGTLPKGVQMAAYPPPLLTKEDRSKLRAYVFHGFDLFVYIFA